MKLPDFKITMTILIALPLMLGSCVKNMLPGITGHGDVVTEYVSIEEFTGFANAISANVYISQGDEQEVRIEAQQNIIDNIDLDYVVSGFWTIKYHRWVRNAKPVRIYITIPTLDEAVISGSGEVMGETFFEDLDHLKLRISGSGNMALDCDSNEIDLTISGSGDFDVAGSTKRLDAKISGSGSIRAFDLETVEADMRISGSGGARLNVSDYLNATISGSGNIVYRGNPELDVHVTGSGDVLKDR